MSDVALRLAGVGKSFDGFEAVRDLSFEVPRGAICGFLGPNGAGKTTSVRMMLGLTAPTRGEIEVLGAPVGRLLDRIGFMPEERGLYRKMTALDVIVFLAGLKGVKAGAARERGRRMLEAQGLGAFAHTQIRSLSKGMSQKVQLISCLVHEPELVILDEPTSGLDPLGTLEMKNLIKELKRAGKTVLLSSHNLSDVEDVCDRICILYRGKIEVAGTIDELLNVQDVFKVEARNVPVELQGRMVEMLREAGASEIHPGVQRSRLADLFSRMVLSKRAAERGSK